MCAIASVPLFTGHNVARAVDPRPPCAGQCFVRGRTMNRVQVILFYLVDQVMTSPLLSASMPVLEGYSEGSLFLPVLQAQDAVLLRKECFVLCLLLDLVVCSASSLCQVLV